MISSPEIFYQTFQKDFHKIKAIYLKGMLDNLTKYEKDLFDDALDIDDKNNFKLALKSDLRQTYFHAIETFFELFFGLNPKGGKPYADRYILFTLTHSNFAENYKKIRAIAETNDALNFLEEKVKFNEHQITIGQYLFYMGIVRSEKFDEEFLEQITASIEGIKNAIKIIAQDFVKREEYNAYKHGLRIIPSTTKLGLADAETMEMKFEWDLSDSMSFYMKMKDPEELKVITKVFDIERDYSMTILCSDLIHQLIFFRRLSMRLDGDKGKFEEVAIPFITKERVKLDSKINVEIQDIIYSITKVK